MSFALHHFVDLAGILAGLIFLINTIGKSAKSPRGLLFFRLAAIMLLIGGGLGWLHYFQNIGWVHRHSYAIFFYGWTFKNVAFGMMLVLIFLGVPKDFQPRKKVSLS